MKLNKLYIILIILLFAITPYCDDEMFILVGTKFSDIKGKLHETYITTESSQDRITYSFIGDRNNLTQIAVKNDIIEVIEVYNVFDDENDALKLFTDLCVYLATEKHKISIAYNSTIEFTKNNITTRVEQLPSQYGWLIKYTSYMEK